MATDLRDRKTGSVKVSFSANVNLLGAFFAFALFVVSCAAVAVGGSLLVQAGSHLLLGAYALAGAAIVFATVYYAARWVWRYVSKPNDAGLHVTDVSAKYQRDGD